MTEPTQAPDPLPLTRRRELLDHEVVRKIGIYKGRLAHQTDVEAVIITGKPVNHVLHLLLSVLTLGLWLLVWPFVAIGGGERRVVLRVDEQGEVRQWGPY